ncbi:MAG: TY-Chap domain-containing protein [Dietzia sp.]
MPAFDFDVDASIAAGWDRFASHLADLLRDLIPGATFDLAVPVLGAPSPLTPYIRFTAVGQRRLEAEVSGGGSEDAPTPLRPVQLAQLSALGWQATGPGEVSGPAAGPIVALPTDRAPELAHLVAGTLEQVFGIRHPVFLHDVVAEGASDPGAPAGADPVDPPGTRTDDPAAPADPGTVGEVVRDDFRPQPITDPDQATRAVGEALTEVYRRRIDPDEHDVFTVPAGCVLLFVRAHRSLPLIVFRSQLVTGVQDAAAAETEVAILNRDSLWCRYVFDGSTVTAESEFVDRVFVPVNFKIQLAEITAELDDVYPDLARRLTGPHARDLRGPDDPDTGET